jgi:hypothetical protein
MHRPDSGFIVPKSKCYQLRPRLYISLRFGYAKVKPSSLAQLNCSLLIRPLLLADILFAGLISWSQIRQEYPLNLSISISGGKETNKDSPSNGEWSGKSSNLKSSRFPGRIVVSRSIFGSKPGISPLEQGIVEGDNPVFGLVFVPMWYTFKESGCLGMQPKMGGKYHLKLNNGERPIANKYREGKMKRTLKRELNSTWNCQKGNAWNQYWPSKTTCSLGSECSL